MRELDHARFGPVIADLLQDRRVSPLDRGSPDPALRAKLQALDAEGCIPRIGPRGLDSRWPADQNRRAIHCGRRRCAS